MGPTQKEVNVARQNLQAAGAWWTDDMHDRSGYWIGPRDKDGRPIGDARWLGKDVIRATNLIDEVTGG